MSYLTDEERLKKQHIVLMRHQEAALYSGVIMMGESHVADGVPTPTGSTRSMGVSSCVG